MMESGSTGKVLGIVRESWTALAFVVFAVLGGCSSNSAGESDGGLGAGEMSSNGGVSAEEEVDDVRNWGSLEQSAAFAISAPPVNAQMCSSGGECPSGFCVDGVCCDSACTGTCEACTAAKKGNGADGTCGLIALYGDPDNECASGSCDGTGACKLYNGNTCAGTSECLSGYCVDGFCCGNECTGTCRACSIAKRGGGYNGQCGPIASGSDPDNECSSGSCNGSSACQTVGGGNSCSQNSDCSTGFCVDGVCCDTSCTGTCEACSAAIKGGGADGTCGPIQANADPSNECADGVCNGSGGCIKYNGASCAGASECISTYCVDGFCCGNECSGTCRSCAAAKHGGFNGQCLPITANTDPDNECIAGDCNGSGACTSSMTLANGSACSAGAECSSNHCVDGVCCDTACAGTCDACSATKKGSGANGTCGPIAANTDPENDCPDGVCDGSSGCIKYNGATCADAGECISTYCVDGFCCGNACTGTCYSCSAVKNGGGYNGQCLPIAASTDPDGECGAGTCDGAGMCTTPMLLPNGSACSSNAECDLSFCTDGYCCNVECAGACQACSAAKKGSGIDGTCGFIATGTDPDTECASGTCDGNGACSGGACTGTLWLSELPILPVDGSIAAADLNGDGIIDLAVTSTANDAVGVMLGNGNGTYVAKVDYPVGPNPTSIITADMNGDGKLDLVVTDSISKGVSVVLNNGNGTFGPKLDFSFGAVVPRAVAAADVNGDGNVDLALPMANNTMSVLLNTGAGTFYAHLSYATGTNPVAIASADLNADGNADLVVPNSSSNNVSVFINNGNGTLAPKVDYNVSSPQSVVVADMNGDGKSDIVTTDGVLFNNGDGTFAAYLSTPPLSLAGAAAAGDINGDGKTDIAVVQHNTNDVRVFLNNGNGTAFSRTIYTTPRGPNAIALADLNGNGVLDIAVGTNAGLSIILGSGNGAFATNLDYATGAIPYSVTTADFNGDGQQDLAIANGSGASVSVLFNNGDDTFATKEDYSAGSAPRSVVAADVNGDGHPDLAVANYSSNDVSVHINNGDGTFAPKTAYMTGPYGNALGPNSVAAADFNGDGAIDLVAANNQGAPTGTVAVLLNNGNGTFAAVVNYGLGVNPAAVTAADFNGDGKPDLAITNEGSHTVSVLVNNGNGTFAPKVDYATGTAFGGFPIYIVTADVDGNNMPDLVVANRTGGVTVHLNNGNGTFAPKVTYETTPGWYSVTLADMDGDGNRDIVATNRDNNTVSVLRNISGNGTFAPRIDYATGRYPRAVAAVDISGDGKPDLAVVNEQSNTVRVLLNSCLP